MPSSLAALRREIGELEEALNDALSGHGQLNLLVGEPGIGKTRIAQELAAHSLRMGIRVLRSTCYLREGDPPY